MKVAEVRDMSIADLKDRIQGERTKLRAARLNHAVSQSEDTSKFSKSRKDIARMLTILAQKEKEQK